MPTPPGSPKAEKRTEEESSQEQSEEQKSEERSEPSSPRNVISFFGFTPTVVYRCPAGHMHVLDDSMLMAVLMGDPELMLLVALASRIADLDLGTEDSLEETVNQEPQFSSEEDTEDKKVLDEEKADEEKATEELKEQQEEEEEEDSEEFTPGFSM